MKIALVLDTICEAFLVACEDKEQAERYIENTRIKGFATIKEQEIEDGLENDIVYVVTRAKNERFVYCSGNPIKELDGKDYVSRKVPILKRIKNENSGNFVFDPMREERRY